MPKRITVTEDQKTEIVAAALAGEKQSDIAARVGLSPMTVSRIVREVTGVNKTRTIDEETRQAIVAAHKAGMTQREIASKFKTTQPTVSNVLKRAT